MAVPRLSVHKAFAELLMQANELHSVDIKVLEVSKHLLMAPLPQIKDQVIIEKAKFLHIYVFSKWLFCGFVSIASSQLHLFFNVEGSLTVSYLDPDAVQ